MKLWTAQLSGLHHVAVNALVLRRASNGKIPEVGALEELHLCPDYSRMCPGEFIDAARFCAYSGCIFVSVPRASVKSVGVILLCEHQDSARILENTDTIRWSPD